MAQHRKTTKAGSGKSPLVSIGTAGAALVGAGFLLAAPPGAAGPVSTVIQLASVDSPMPLAPSNGTSWWLDIFGPKAAAPAAVAPNALIKATAQAKSCGLVCNGADGTAANPDGQNGGLLWGNGGNGWNATTPGANGGNGGMGGLFGGNGGNGGNGG